MKAITFISKSLKSLRSFPEQARREAGFQLDRVQKGLEPTDWKPMTSIGGGVKEIRIHHEGQYRVIYVAKFEEAIYVLHAFRKKTQKTSKKDLEAATKAYKQLLEKQ